jgi:uncharacterized protein YjbI with pentapeptide repeats
VGKIKFLEYNLLMGRSTGKSKQVSKSVTKTRNVLLGESDYQINSPEAVKKDNDLISFLLSIQTDSRDPLFKEPVEADLAQKIFKDIGLFSINFTGSAWTGSKIENVNFSNLSSNNDFIFSADDNKASPSVFNHASFEKVVIDNVSFKKTVLHEVDFSSANINQADFSLAQFKDVSFKESKFTGPETRIASSKFTMASLDNVNFAPGTILKGVAFSGAKFLTSPSFQENSLEEVIFNDNDLSNANFQDTITKGLIVSQVDLGGASFKGAHLNQSMFTKISAQQAIDFSNSQIYQLNASDSDLTKANFTNTDLTETNFENVDLTGVDLTNTRFRGVSFNNCQLKGAKFAPGAPGIRFINCLGV